jgi:DNA-binding transcriptional MocR family regulator
VLSGGLGRNTSGIWTKSEAERFAAIAISEGVPGERIILEKKSKNSAENLLFTPKILAEAGIRIRALSEYYHDSDAQRHCLVVNYSGIKEENLQQALDVLKNIM